jgi:hypothetical protein
MFLSKTGLLSFAQSHHGNGTISPELFLIEPSVIAAAAWQRDSVCNDRGEVGFPALARFGFGCREIGLSLAAVASGR